MYVRGSTEISLTRQKSQAVTQAQQPIRDSRFILGHTIHMCMYGGSPIVHYEVLETRMDFVL